MATEMRNVGASVEIIALTELLPWLRLLPVCDIVSRVPLTDAPELDDVYLLCSSSYEQPRRRGPFLECHVEHQSIVCVGCGQTRNAPVDGIGKVLLTK